MRDIRFMQLYWKRRAGAVRRFHTEDWSGTPETVAHHSANTALLLLEVLGPENISKELLIVALEHDLAEKFVGDVPAPAKWANADLRDALHITELAVRSVMGCCTPDLSCKEALCLKAADTLDCCLSALDQRMLGNQTADALFGRLQAYIHSSQVLDVHKGFWDIFLEIENAYSEVSHVEEGFLHLVAKTYVWKSPSPVGLEDIPEPDSD